jgi:hypothetical protein
MRFSVSYYFYEFNHNCCLIYIFCFLGEMLRVTPNDIIIFTKSETEYVGTFDIINIGAKPITYKVSILAIKLR